MYDIHLLIIVIIIIVLFNDIEKLLINSFKEAFK